MIIQTGAKIGKSTQELLLKEADWVQFFVDKNPMANLSIELKRHVRSLNAKAFTEKCFCCSQLATYMTAYYGNAMSLMYWCSSCDPYSQGARQGMLRKIITVKDALDFVDIACRGKRTDKRHIVRELAHAKGCSARVTKAVAIAFLP